VMENKIRVNGEVVHIGGNTLHLTMRLSKDDVVSLIDHDPHKVPLMRLLLKLGLEECLHHNVIAESGIHKITSTIIPSYRIVKRL